MRSAYHEFITPLQVGEYLLISIYHYHSGFDVHLNSIEIYFIWWKKKIAALELNFQRLKWKVRLPECNFQIAEYDIGLLEESSYLKESYSDIEFCSDPMDVVKIIFLGAQGVGKTSIIQVE